MCTKASYTELYRAYKVDRLPMTEILALFGYSHPAAVYKRMKKLGIEPDRPSSFNRRPRRSDSHNHRFTHDQKAIVVGTVLGDGCLAKSPGGANYSLRINHSPKQREYILWLQKALEPFSKPLRESSSLIQLYISTHPWLTSLRAMAYNNRQKVVSPLLLAQSPNPCLTTAILIMDDGNFNKNVGNITIAVHGFDQESQHRLLFWLKTMLDVEGRLWKHGKWTRIGFPVAETKKLVKQIEPYTIPSMSYKLGC